MKKDNLMCMDYIYFGFLIKFVRKQVPYDPGSKDTFHRTNGGKSKA